MLLDQCRESRFFHFQRKMCLCFFFIRPFCTFVLTTSLNLCKPIYAREQKQKDNGWEEHTHTHTHTHTYTRKIHKHYEQSTGEFSDAIIDNDDDDNDDDETLPSLGGWMDLSLAHCLASGGVSAPGSLADLHCFVFPSSLPFFIYLFNSHSLS